MFHAKIIRNRKVIAETQYAREDAYACAIWAHCIGWNVDYFDDNGGKLSSDCGGKIASLVINKVQS